jgi:hypothetical protein
METAIRSGIPRREALHAIGTILLDRLPVEEALAWVDAHHDEIQFDDQLAAKARNASPHIVAIGGVPTEIIGIQWASRIHDPERRLRISSALFHKFAIRDHADAAEWIDHPHIPEDLRAPLQSILLENR